MSHVLGETLTALFILFLAMLGPHCGMSFSLVETSRGYSLVVVQRLLIVVASPVVGHRLNTVHRLSCFVARGIFPDQGIKLLSPALAGRFSTTEPPGKPHHNTYYKELESRLGKELLQTTKEKGKNVNIHFTEDIKIDNTHRKRCPTSLVIWEMY